MTCMPSPVGGAGPKPLFSVPPGRPPRGCFLRWSLVVTNIGMAITPMIPAITAITPGECSCPISWPAEGTWIQDLPMTSDGNGR